MTFGWSKRAGLRAGFGAVIAVLILSAFEAYWIQVNVSRQHLEIYRHFVEQEDALSTLRRNLWLAGNYVRDFFINTTPAQAETLRAQLEELQRVSRLRRFLSPQVAELVISSGDDSFLRSHRREIVVVFCDLRGFTAFAESSEPEEVMAVLAEYHAALGELIFHYQGTLERFTGDGLMVFFNDPIPLDEPARRAVEMALAMRDRIATLVDGWSRLGHDLGFGVGIAQGFATLGRIGYEGRFDYAAIGSVTNLAARLCAEAEAGQILVAQRVFHAVENHAVGESVGILELRGFSRSIHAYSVSSVINSSVEVPS